MFRQGHPQSPSQQYINIILMNGGVGDHMASLVAVDYIIKTYPWIKPIVFVPDFLQEFALNVLPNKTILRSFTDMAKHYDRNLPTKTTAWDGITSPMKIHCLDYAFLKLCDEKPNIKHMNYLKIKSNKINIGMFSLPKKYVVITTGYTAAVREFPASSINEISAYIHNRGYEVVFLGQTSTKTGAAHTIEGVFNDTIDFRAGLNLIDKTSLLQAAKIMSNAQAVLGVDNGLLHVAGCTDVPIIGGFTTVSPELRMPVRNNEVGYRYYPVVPENALGCRFCQVKTNFIYGHNYTQCLYEDNLCTTQMTASKFIAHLEALL